MSIDEAVALAMADWAAATDDGRAGGIEPAT
jgi:hypothetical protein